MGNTFSIREGTVKHNSPLFGPLEEEPEHLRSPPLLPLLLAIFYNNLDLYRKKNDDLNNKKKDFVRGNHYHHYRNIKTVSETCYEQLAKFRFNLHEEKDLRSVLNLLLPNTHTKHGMTNSISFKRGKKQNPNIEQRLAFNTLYKGTAIKRIGVFRMVRNIVLVLGTSSDKTRPTETNKVMMS